MICHQQSASETCLIAATVLWPWEDLLLQTPYCFLLLRFKLHFDYLRERFGL